MAVAGVVDATDVLALGAGLGRFIFGAGLRAFFARVAFLAGAASFFVAGVLRTCFLTFFGAARLLLTFRAAFRRRFGGALPAAASFFARRSSRYFLIFAFGKSLCLAQTIPKIGAAGFLHPGTGQSWRGDFFRGLETVALSELALAVCAFGGRPRRLGAGPPKALRMESRARVAASASISATSCDVKSAINERSSFMRGNVQHQPCRAPHSRSVPMS